MKDIKWLPLETHTSLPSIPQNYSHCVKRHGKMKKRKYRTKAVENKCKTIHRTVSETNVNRATLFHVALFDI